MNKLEDEEIVAINRLLQSGNVTMGEKTLEFEKEFASYIGSKYCVAVNSGSSANLLMVAAWTLRYGKGTVIVPAIGWATSYSPFQQYGWKLKFVDINAWTLNYDIQELKKAEGDLILAINLLGNPNEFSDFPSIPVLEDNCESLGAEYKGKKTGTFGVMSSHSTYYSHQMSTIEGGMITTDDEFFYHMLLSLRSHGWTRHLPEKNLLKAKVEKFNFILPGYNVRPTDLQSVIGLEQLKKLPKIIERHHSNYESFKDFCETRHWDVQEEPKDGYSSAFGCAFFSEDMNEIRKRFDKYKIDYRPIMSHFTKSDVINYFDYEAEELPNADWVYKNGIFLNNNAQVINWDTLIND